MITWTLHSLNFFQNKITKTQSYFCQKALISIIKTKKKSKQALIDAILKHEGEVKGTVLPEEQYQELEQQHNILKLKNTKGNRSISAMYQNLGAQKTKLKEMRQKTNRDLFAERIQMEKIANMEDTIKQSKKVLLKEIKGTGLYILNSVEDTNGLTHVYRLTNDRILDMCRE
jgi:hypothetical protein